ncbi:nuclear transport factor 2 family protein [Amycolatopsis sp. GM8]|uniref:nuclear transport factor 2 family protein n=1 Tax=Amycolatopsis sp. GM8 TaxID=2896530 RepID=UPI001F4282CC|nr:nuclear transport factor 2 family protein [Amycolatopsis sp. GM8]
MSHHEDRSDGQRFRATLDSFFAAETRYVAAGGAEVGADFGEMAAHLHPEVVMHQGPRVPFPGDWVGVHGIERFFAAFSQTFRSIDLREIRYFTGDEGLAIRLRLRAIARATGRQVDSRVGHLILFDDGLIRDWTVFYLDPVAVTKATRS